MGDSCRLDTETYGLEVIVWPDIIIAINRMRIKSCIRLSCWARAEGFRKKWGRVVEGQGLGRPRELPVSQKIRFLSQPQPTFFDQLRTSLVRTSLVRTSLMRTCIFCRRRLGLGNWEASVNQTSFLSFPPDHLRPKDQPKKYGNIPSDLATIFRIIILWIYEFIF
jgi:hypothetical protein